MTRHTRFWSVCHNLRWQLRVFVSCLRAPLSIPAHPALMGGPFSAGLGGGGGLLPNLHPHSPHATGPLNTRLKLQSITISSRFQQNIFSNATQEKPTTCGTKAPDAPDKFFTLQAQCDSIDYIDALATTVRTAWQGIRGELMGGYLWQSKSPHMS